VHIKVTLTPSAVVAGCGYGCESETPKKAEIAEMAMKS